jgi:hypothetical protein
MDRNPIAKPFSLVVRDHVHACHLSFESQLGDA